MNLLDIAQQEVNSASRPDRQLQDQFQIQKLSSENQKLRTNLQESLSMLQKVTEENHQLRTDLSETQKLNQSLSRNNDILRNKRGLLLRREQERLEEGLKAAQVQIADLEKKVDYSSVEAVEKAKREKEEAIVSARLEVNGAYYMAERVKQEAEQSAKRAKETADERCLNAEKNEFIWFTGMIVIMLLTVIRNRALLDDIADCMTLPLKLWECIKKYADWLHRPTYIDANPFGADRIIEFSTGTAWALRIISLIALFLGIFVMIEVIRWIAKQYQTQWDDNALFTMIITLAVLAAIGDIIQNAIHVNLVMIFLLTQLLLMLVKKHNFNEQR